MERNSQQRAAEYFNQLYEETKQRTLALITAKCGNLDDIQDIFQDTYVEIYAIICRKGIDYIEHPQAFTDKIARQKIYRYYRLVDRIKKHFIYPKETEDREGDADLTELAIDTFEIEEWLDEQAAKRKIEMFLEKKSIEIRKIFYLFYHLEKTIPEIAMLMEISESNVKNKIYRTIKEMRELYQKEEVSL